MGEGGPGVSGSAMLTGILVLVMSVFVKVQMISKQLTKIGVRLDGLEGAGVESSGTGE